MTAAPPVPAWKHQQAGRQFVRQLWGSGQRAALLAMIMGSGKSRLAIDLINDLQAFFPLIICPVRVVEVWRAQFEKYSANNYEFAALDDRFPSVRDKFAMARDMRAWALERSRRLVICINYESARAEPFASWALKTPWPVVVADECVPPGSLISTPDGDRPIESLEAGDRIWGYDHSADTVVETKVTATFQRQTTSPLVNIQKARLTPSHPVWTARGYVTAIEIKPTDEVLCAQYEESSHHLRVLPKTIVRSEEEGPILQQERGEARLVHNLETETANYFVNGLLVHNCHRVKDGSGRTSRWLAKLGRCARYRLGLTGTPMPHSPLDVWGQFRFLDPSIYDPTFGSFKMRHARMGGYKNKEIVGWKDLDELYAKFRSIAFQVDESALDLPEAIDETLETDLTSEGKRVYLEMENEMVAWIRDMDGKGVEVTAANAMVRLQRLQQITGGSLPDEAGRPVPVDAAKEALLADFLADLGDEHVVIFAVYKADLQAIRRAAKDSGLQYAEISGAHNELERWKSGAATVLGAQIQSGAEGIDLTRARVAVYYSHGFSLAQYRQSRARIWRPPQSRACAFYHLQIRNSIDQYVLRAVLARQDLVESVLKGLRRS